MSLLARRERRTSSEGERENAVKEGEIGGAGLQESSLGCWKSAFLPMERRCPPRSFTQREGMWGASFQKTSGTLLIFWWGLGKRCEKGLQLGRISKLSKSKI